MNLFYFLKNIYKKIFNKEEIKLNLINKKINKKRKIIDKIDKIILNKILERTLKAKEIIELKINMGLNIEDKKRENEIKENIKIYIKNRLKKIEKDNIKLNENYLLEKIDEIFNILFFLSKN